MAPSPALPIVSPHSAGRTTTARFRFFAARGIPPSPSVAAVRAMQREHPGRSRIELHVDPRRHGSNRKVSNLINMMPRARHDTIVLSDSDIVVHPGYLRAIAALLASPRVGAVTCLYHGIGGDGLWSRLSALAINSHFLPQAITGLALKLTKPCFGATIAVERSTLEQIGGFGRFADELADDYAIGMAVRSAGYEVVTAPFLVGHRCFEDSLRQLVRHQIRVARTIKSIDPIGYAGYDHHPSVAARSSRHAVGQHRCGAGCGRGAGFAHCGVPLRRTAVWIAAGKPLAHSAAGRYCFRRLRGELFWGDGSLAGGRLSRDELTAPSSRKT